MVKNQPIHENKGSIILSIYCSFCRLPASMENTIVTIDNVNFINVLGAAAARVHGSNPVVVVK